jgi:predicted SAM-dependent methyltransferase
MKLHLGCGDVKLPGFVNVDIRPEVHPDVVSDISKLSKFRDNTAEIIYLCHGLEHFRYYEVPAMLVEYKRVLVDGGDLYLAVPDFGAMASEYVFGMIELNTVKAALCGGQEYGENTHYSLWDRGLLTKYLREAGFIQVRTYEPQALLPKGVRDYSTFAIGGVLMSLNLRAS